MLLDWNTYEMYLRPGRTDMRKKAYTLSLLVENEMDLNPFSRSAFLFCSASKRILKVIVWDENGFWELSKRLESKGSFAWPANETEALEVSLEEIQLMLKGADPWRKLPVETPEKVS